MTASVRFAGEPLRVVHHHPGRLRVRAALFRDDLAAVSRVEAALSPLAAVERIHHNPYTGSLLIEYRPGLAEPGAILAAAAAAAGLDGVVEEEGVGARAAELPAAVARGARRLNAVARELTGGADLGVLVPGTLLGAAVLSLLRRPGLPRWDNLLYWTYVLFVDLNRGDAAATTAEGQAGPSPSKRN